MPPRSYRMPVLCTAATLDNSMQFRQGKNPAEWPWQLVMLQISLVNTFKILFQIALKPFGQQTYIPQIMGGIAMGPSLLSRNDTVYKLFSSSAKGLQVIGVLRAMGFMFLLYLLSMRIDISIMKKCGKLAVVIGITSLLVPLLFATLFSYFLREFYQHNSQLFTTLPAVAALVSTTSFHVILVVLTDLKLLNSELGRLALASSMISGISSWGFLEVLFDIQEHLERGSKEGLVLAQLSKIAVIVIIVFIFRPIMQGMVRRTPDGKPLKESYVCGICLMILICAFCSEITGQHFYFAPVIMGMATPDGPPIVSSLMEKLDCFVEAVLVPCYVIDAGRRSDISVVGKNEFGAIQLIMFVASFSKFASIIIPAYCFKMPFSDAVSLGFIMNCKGLFDVQLYSRANRLGLITDQNFTILVFSTALHAGLFSWLAKLFYDPSRRYVAYTKRTVQYSNESSSELRILACIHQQDNVPSIIGILEDSHPTKQDPVEVCVMSLKNSPPGTVPLLIPHQTDIFPNPSFNKQSEINHIINAFSQIQNRNAGLFMNQFFTSYAPYPTLHDAVCSMALAKTSTLVLLPFLHSDDPSIRIVNKNILQQAPCSVGILFDSGKVKRSILPSKAMRSACIIFLGGPDDRETLAYGARMATHPYVKLTLIRLVSMQENSDADLIERRRDLNMINEFKHRTAGCRNCVGFEEHMISQGFETAKLLRAVCMNFDLMVVGRRHDTNSSLLSGLTEWKELEELGVVGDMLASKDFQCTALVLVIQQQASVVLEMIESPRNISKSVSDISSSKFVSSRWG
ncbi:cation/H(+) antiporter 27-like [Mercurialis annua]|uniref:cation/H(+) antiporter 27-like n=1 Tax=Mercurialis annua TaxID=3986 RepID=UPI00216019DA|nr:cation/H(+) antiporter 27-like [Mercurialis annua]